MRPIGPFTQLLRDLETIRVSEWLTDAERDVAAKLTIEEFLQSAHSPQITEIVTGWPTRKSPSRSTAEPKRNGLHFTKHGADGESSRVVSGKRPSAQKG